MFPRRMCPVCLGKTPEVIFQQKFASYSDGGLMAGYNVAICGSCGAGYADEIPSQAQFDRYYAEMSKYEHAHRGGRISDVDSARFVEVVDLVVPHIKAGDRIVDVGCATGGLLAEFKRRGFDNLQGYDPSKTCCEVAKRLYQINATPSTIRGLTSHAERSDLVMMTGVLEHLADLDASLLVLQGMLAASGKLYVEVPDATRYDEWFSSPYQFFSMEHVNFFSPCSLSNLLARHGFSVVFIKRVQRFIGAQSVEPGIAALFQPSHDTVKMVFDTETSHRLRRYINKSAKLEKAICEKIASLALSRIPLAVWGVGTHTLRLLATSDLKNANIVSFLDSNSRYHGKTLRGIKIENPLQFKQSEATILISSHMAQDDIKNTIEHKLGLKNPVICLYEGVPTRVIS